MWGKVDSYVLVVWRYGLPPIISSRRDIGQALGEHEHSVDRLGGDRPIEGDFLEMVVLL